MSVAQDYLRKISKEEINLLPLFYYDGDVVLVRDAEELDAAMCRIRKERLLGFDTESKPCFRKGSVATPALVQVACSDIVFLFQLSHLPFDERLSSLLEDPGQIKAGVAIAEDLRQLAAIHPFTAASVVDLGECAMHHGMETRGLRTLAANLLGARISKSAQCSNWASSTLSLQQIRYAATDAWVSRLLYRAMESVDLLDQPACSVQVTASKSVKKTGAARSTRKSATRPAASRKRTPGATSPKATAENGNTASLK